jgi:hypothetical protein
MEIFMRKLLSFVKAIRLKQILTVFFAGVMLFLNTACSSSAQAQMPDTKSYDRGPKPVGQNQPYVGGMNNFSDTAPGAAAKGSSDKAKALIDNAEQNITSDNPLDANPRNAKLYKNPGYAAERTKDTLGNSFEERTSNLKDEAQRAGERFEKSLDRATDKTKELGQRLQQGAENVKDNVQDAADDTALGARRGGEVAKDKAAKAARDTGRSIEDAGRKANRSIQDSID